MPLIQLDQFSTVGYHIVFPYVIVSIHQPLYVFLVCCKLDIGSAAAGNSSGTVPIQSGGLAVSITI